MKLHTIRFCKIFPTRVDFLINLYKTPKEKFKFLFIGADNNKVNESRNDGVKKLFVLDMTLKRMIFLV